MPKWFYFVRACTNEVLLNLRTKTVGLRAKSMKPPALVVDDKGVEVRFDDRPQYRIDWIQIREIAVEVTVIAELEYSEAFWLLKGEGIDFGAPVELVAGASNLFTRLSRFEGFDQTQYQCAREAEGLKRPGRFICWSAGGT